MIAVIADDLTGAAELAGIGITYGLTVELAMSVNPQSKADLLVISTDARSVSVSEAVEEMEQVSRELRAIKPQLIFKKIDSVLRGHVVAETSAQMKVLGLAKALIVPANPALGRILIDGHYYVQGTLIHETHFSKDPEFPIAESNVMKRLAVNDVPISVQPPASPLLRHGITIGEVGTQSDLKWWADRIDRHTLPVGGAGFFTAILSGSYMPKCLAGELNTFGQHRLFVCGTAFGASVELVKSAAMAGKPVCYMPSVLMHLDESEPAELVDWVAEIVTCFLRHEQVIIAIDPESTTDSCKLAVRLRTMMAKAVKQVLDQISVDELIIEGGSTASAVLRAIDVTRLAPTQELAPGVVRSAAIGRAPLQITVKPGSYQWPTDLWTF